VLEKQPFKNTYGLTDPSGGKIEVKLGENWIDMTQKGPFGRAVLYHI